MADDEIELRVEKDGTAFVVVDQHGRRLRGVRSITLIHRYKEATTATVEFLTFKDGKPEVAR